MKHTFSIGTPQINSRKVFVQSEKFKLYVNQFYAIALFLYTRGYWKRIVV